MWFVCLCMWERVYASLSLSLSLSLSPCGCKSEYWVSGWVWVGACVCVCMHLCFIRWCGCTISDLALRFSFYFSFFSPCSENTRLRDMSVLAGKIYLGVGAFPALIARSDLPSLTQWWTWRRLLTPTLCCRFPMERIKLKITQIYWLIPFLFNWWPLKLRHRQLLLTWLVPIIFSLRETACLLKCQILW